MAIAIALRVIDQKLEAVRKELKLYSVSVIMTDNSNNKILYKGHGYTMTFWESCGQWESNINGNPSVMEAKMISKHLHYWRMLCEK